MTNRIELHRVAATADAALLGNDLHVAAGDECEGYSIDVDDDYSLDAWAANDVGIVVIAGYPAEFDADASAVCNTVALRMSRQELLDLADDLRRIAFGLPEARG